MIGLKIAATGLLIFVFSLLIYQTAKADPVQPRLKDFAALGGAIGLIAMPVGLLIAIWL